MSTDRGRKNRIERASTPPGEEDVPPALRRTVERALYRLELFEWIILFAIGAFSIGGGALVALIAEYLAGVSFRLSWLLASVLFFGIPGWLVLWRGNR